MWEWFKLDTLSKIFLKTKSEKSTKALREIKKDYFLGIWKEDTHHLDAEILADNLEHIVESYDINLNLLVNMQKILL